MRFLDTRSFVYAFNCTAAALLALGIAFAAGLPSPWWASLTVFLTSQPLAAASGALVARALYRVAGTVLGLAATMVFVPALASEPELLIGAVAAWLAVCVCIALGDRSPRGHAFLLAGYTLALVGLPLAGDPSTLFDNAVGRTEEISLGAVCAVLVQGLVFPRDVRPMLLARLDASLRDARGWIVAALSPDAASANAALRSRMAIDLTEFNQLALAARYDTGGDRADRSIVSAFEERMVALLPLMASVEDRIGAIREQGAVPPSLVIHLLEVRRWMAGADNADNTDGTDRTDRTDEGRTQRLIAAGRHALPAPGTLPPWTELLGVSLLQRLAELAQAHSDAWHLSQWIRDPARPLDSRARRLAGPQSRRRLQVDHVNNAFAGFACGVTVIVTAALAAAAGWQQGAVAVGVAAASSAVFSFSDDPRPMQKVLVFWSIAAVPVSALYIFAILPLIDGFGALAFALAPLFFGTALLLASPKHWLQGLAFALISQTLIALQPALQANFDVFASVALASVAGGIVAVTVTSLIRVIGAETSAWHILRAGWHELAAPGNATTVSRNVWAGRMLDRAGMLIPRLAKAGGIERLRHADALGDLRMGVNVADLRAVASDTDGSAVALSIDAALHRVADHFRSQMRRGVVPPDAALLGAIDRAIARLLTMAAGDLRMRGLAAATGLRRGLFANAPAYGVDESNHVR